MTGTGRALTLRGTGEQETGNRIDHGKGGFQKFHESEYRAHQRDAILAILDCKKKFCVIEAPTGMGKSIIGMVAGKLTGKTTYLVHSRMLQTQLNDDFTEVPILWGKGNYPCMGGEGYSYSNSNSNSNSNSTVLSSPRSSDLVDTGASGASKLGVYSKPGGYSVGDGEEDVRVMCDCCTHGKGHPCKSFMICEYRTAKRMAQESQLRVLNYDYFLSEANHVGKFSGSDLVIVDEADSLEDTLVGHIRIEMSERMIARLKIGYPKWKTGAAKDGVKSWKDWAVRAQTGLKRVEQGMQAKVDSYEYIYCTEQVDVIKQLGRVTAMLNKLGMFLRHVDEKWLYEETSNKYGKGIMFRPVWLEEALADEFMWRHGKKFVLMSATFHKPHILSKLLGIPLKDIEFHSYPSTFPLESRQVAIRPVANLTYKTMDEEVPKLIKEIEGICRKHHDVKGLIHCVSYGLAKKILEGIQDEEVRKRIVIHTGKDKIDVIRMFKESDEPLVLMSPSSERGISLDGDYCRFIIWAKAPFLNLNDKLVQARIYGDRAIGQDWYVSHMLLGVVQGCGRGTRSREDYCSSYILDQQIAVAFTRHTGMIPDWVMDACW
jgi:Rad3-related DNA helicase